MCSVSIGTALFMWRVSSFQMCSILSKALWLINWNYVKAYVPLTIIFYNILCPIYLHFTAIHQFQAIYLLFLWQRYCFPSDQPNCSALFIAATATVTVLIVNNYTTTTTASSSAATTKNNNYASIRCTRPEILREGLSSTC